MDKCLEIVDAQLYRYLNSKKLTATVYAFPSVMTFCACTQPLPELIKLWDFLIAYGIHLNILCVISQIILIKNELINSPSPMKQLRILPDLDAAKIINITLGLIPLLPEDLYDLLVRHPFDPMIYDDIDVYCMPM
jgi:cell cycle arrest protein BUB2